jgi:hypothetical protein
MKPSLIIQIRMFLANLTLMPVLRPLSSQPAKKWRDVELVQITNSTIF